MPPSGPGVRTLAGWLLLLLLSASPSVQDLTHKCGCRPPPTKRSLRGGQGLHRPAPSQPEKASGITSCLRFSPSLGEKIRVCCHGETAHPESGIMYWLANDTFVDQLYPNGSVKEEPTVEKGSQLTRALIFSPLMARDLHTSFDCIITDPSGVFRKAILWDYPDKKKTPQD
ncbi:interleukin-18-binding protein [Vipera latastei]